MAPGIHEKPLLEVDERLPLPRLLQEQRSHHLLRITPNNCNAADKLREDKRVQMTGANEVVGEEEEEKKRNERDQIKIQLILHDDDKEQKCEEYMKIKADKEEGGGGREEGGGEGGGGGEEGGGRRRGTDANKEQHRGWQKSYFYRYRDLIAYWFLGFCNNFTYWVMITSAYDLLAPEFQATYMDPSPGGSQRSLLQASDNVSEQATIFSETTKDLDNSRKIFNSGYLNESSNPIINTFECQKISTGFILVADTLPATVLTLGAPLTLLLSVGTRVWLLSLLCGASYLTLGLAHPRFVFLGVALASASRGFSDSTFLGHASHYHKHVLSMWASGTGVATFIGPLLYSSLTTGGLDPRHALLIFLAIPFVTVGSFWCLLSRYEDHQGRRTDVGDIPQEEEAEELRPEQDNDSEKQKMSSVFQEKIILFMRALKYLLPLAAFYFIMYVTNQGLLELVYFPASVLTHAQQYSWSNTIRCLGTLISRSAHHVMLLPSAWIYNSIAVAILCIVGTEAYYHYLPSEYIIFSLLLLQGLVEGTAYRTCVFKIHNKTNAKDRTFCLGVFPISLFLPALLAGLVSMPLHDTLCRNHTFKM